MVEMVEVVASESTALFDTKVCEINYLFRFSDYRPQPLIITTINNGHCYCLMINCYSSKNIPFYYLLAKLDCRHMSIVVLHCLLGFHETNGNLLLISKKYCG